MIKADRRIYLGVAVGGVVVFLGMLYVLAYVVAGRQPFLLAAAVVLAAVEMVIVTWIAYRRFRLGSAADTASWVRATRVLTCVVLVLLVGPRIWELLRHG